MQNLHWVNQSQKENLVGYRPKLDHKYEPINSTCLELISLSKIEFEISHRFPCMVQGNAREVYCPGEYEPSMSVKVQTNFCINS